MNEIPSENTRGHGPILISVLCKQGKKMPPKIKVERYENKPGIILPTPNPTRNQAGQSRTRHSSRRGFWT